MEENYKLAKWLNDEMTDSELKEFQSEADYTIFENIKKYSAELTTPNLDEQKVLNAILENKKETKVVAFHQNWFIRIAAILVIGLGLFFSFITFSSQSELAENGKTTTFSLPDNSNVVLNSGSEIEYRKWNWDNHRTLELEGEAYFKVAKGKKFEVNTNLGKVTVLGTQFDVKARNDRFDVTCYEGRVKVDYKNHEVIITKGETVSFENDVKIIQGTIKDIKPVWTENQIAFDKEKLKNAIQEIERQFDVHIDLSKMENTEQLFTGKIPADNIDVALKIILTSYHLEFKKINNKNYIIE